MLPDTTDPTFDSDPAGLSDIACNGTFPDQETLTASDDCSTVSVVPSVDAYTVDICSGYDVTYRWTATDACGNSSETTATFSVLPDTTDPTFDSQPAGLNDIACNGTFPDQETLTASDDCSTVSVVPSVDAYTVDICAGYAVTYRWTATDACGNDTETTATFNVLPDTTDPTFDSDPAGLSDIACNGKFPDQETLTASDDCSTVSVVPSVDAYTVDICAGYAVTYRWTATDACGNDTETTATFNVLPDTTDPTFDSQPAGLNDIACNGTFPDQETLTASDDCSTVSVVPSVDAYTVDICSGYDVTYRWTATDACGNSSETTATFSVLPDTTDPTFDSQPAGLSDIACNGTFPDQETLTASDDCSTVSVVPSVDAYTVDICSGYDVTYRWTATDACGNSSETTATFSVLPDTTDPTFDSDPAGLSDIACNGTFPDQETLTASDDCSTVSVVPSVDAYTVDICSGYDVTYRWTATDACGNSSETTATFSVLPDTTDPTFDSQPAGLNDIACNGTFPDQETLTASDDCSTVSVVPSVDAYTVDICAGYAVTYRWTATDACGNDTETTATFNVLPDTTDPTFDSDPAGLSDIACNGKFPDQETLTASDDCSTVSVVPSVDAYTVDICAGYAVTYRWTATDACGNDTETTATFNVLPDTTDPTFDSQPAGLNDIACNGTFPDQETLTASDDCSTVSVVPSVDAYTVDICSGYDVTYRWTATDACGNSSETTATFSVLPDTTDPTFDSQPAGLSDIACNGTFPDQETLTASDDCSTVSVVPSVDAYTVDICSGYDVTYRWTATDACGNSSETTATFSVLPDTTDPTFDSQPAGLNDIACNGTFPDQETLTASDDCSTVSVVPSVDAYTVDICAGYAVTYRWTATDACGNDTDTTATFNVLGDQEAPVITNCPDSKDFGYEPPVFDTTVTATDDCDTVLEVTYQDADTATYVPGTPSGNAPGSDYKFTCQVNGGPDFDFLTFIWDGNTTVVGGSGLQASYTPVVTGQGTYTLTFEEGTDNPNTNPVEALNDWVLKLDGQLIALKNSQNNDEFPNCQANWIETDYLANTLNCKILRVDCLGDVAGPGETTFMKIRSFKATDDCGKESDLCQVVYTWKEEGDQTGSAPATAVNTESDSSKTAIELDFKAYPVPFDSNVNVKFNFEFDTDVTIEIHDTKGLLVKSMTINGVRKDSDTTRKFDLSRGADQLFYITITTNKGSVTKKVVSSMIKRRKL